MLQCAKSKCARDRRGPRDAQEPARQVAALEGLFLGGLLEMRRLDYPALEAVDALRLVARSDALNAAVAKAFIACYVR